SRARRAGADTEVRFRKECLAVRKSCAPVAEAQIRGRNDGTVTKALASCLLLLLFLSACSTYRPSGTALVKFDVGQTLFDQGKFEESIPYFEQATIEDPQFSQAY